MLKNIAFGIGSILALALGAAVAKEHEDKIKSLDRDVTKLVFDVCIVKDQVLDLREWMTNVERKVNDMYANRGDTMTA